MLHTRTAALGNVALWTAVTLAVLWACFSWSGAELPDTIATHWSGRTPDDSMRRENFAILLAALQLVGAGFAVVASLLADLGRRLVRYSIGGGLAVWSGVVIASALGTVYANRGAATWSDADMSATDLAVVIGSVALLPLLLGLLGVAVSGHQRDEEPETVPVATTELPSGGRVAWSGSQTASRLFIGSTVAAALTLMVSVAATALVGETEAAIVIACTLVVVLASFAVFTGIRVSAGTKGVQVNFGLFGRPRWLIPLRDIESARAEVRGATDVGGWGLRIIPRFRTAVMLRRGECLVLNRSGKTEVTISVDGAAEAAAIVNALVERDHSGRPA